MSARQRLPRLGGRLLRALAAESGTCGTLERDAAAQAASRGFHALARSGGRAARPCAAAAGAFSLRPGSASGAFSLQLLRQFADLPSHTTLAMPSLSPTMSQV